MASGNYWCPLCGSGWLVWLGGAEGVGMSRVPTLAGVAVGVCGEWLMPLGWVPTGMGAIAVRVDRSTAVTVPR